MYPEDRIDIINKIEVKDDSKESSALIQKNKHSIRNKAEREEYYDRNGILPRVTCNKKTVRNGQNPHRDAAEKHQGIKL